MRSEVGHKLGTTFVGVTDNQRSASHPSRTLTQASRDARSRGSAFPQIRSTGPLIVLKLAFEAAVVVVIVVAGSLWVVYELDEHMMPHAMTMEGSQS
jgi:hypothetical protein